MEKIKIKQHRTTKEEKAKIVNRYLAGENGCDIAVDYRITRQAVTGLLRRRNISIRPQTEIQRKYQIDETFFDNIDTQEKAYFLGFLYADGCNYVPKSSVSLCLMEKDKEILVKLNALIHQNKPLRIQKKINSNNTVCLLMHNKHISKTLVKHGCVQRKTHKLIFPEWLKKSLIPHFIRGYMDGDGWIGKKSCSLVSTSDFCNSIAFILKNKFNINSYIRARHPERKHNIRDISISGRNQVKCFLDWIYQDASIYLGRKYVRYIELLNFIHQKNEPKLCSVIGCIEKSFRINLCRKHYNQHRRFCRKNKCGIGARNILLRALVDTPELFQLAVNES